MHVVATAGHVDHGKSSLVKALTGTDPDRLAEEKARGLTIELGFAWTTIGGHEVAFVDVPGHERFVSTMLAGVGPVPVVLFVAAADGGWMPQSQEHLDALDALGVRTGLLVVTRADLADPAAATAEARSRIASTSLAGAGDVAVSARTGEGLAELRTALAELLATLPVPDPSAPVRLWVDRSFTVAGAGTVVTGTLPAGDLHTGDRLALPGGAEVTVRGLQTLGRSATSVRGVARVAVNLRGVTTGQVRRGYALVTPGRYVETAVVDVRWRPPSRPGVGRPGDVPSHADLATQVVVHTGSASVPARVRRLGPRTARLTLQRPLPLHVDDTCVLRDAGRRLVLAGATVLDVVPQPLTRRGAGRALADELESLPEAPDATTWLTRRGVERRDRLVAMGFSDDDLGRAVRAGKALEAGDWLVATDHAEGLTKRLTEEVLAHHRGDPLSPGLTVEAARERLSLPAPALVRRLARPPLSVRGGLVVHTEHEALPPAVRAALTTLLGDFEASPYAAVDPQRLADLGLGRAELGAAVRSGALVRVADRVYLTEAAVEGAAGVLATLPPPFTVGDAKRAWRTTRRVATPLLELLDRRGQTHRLPDGTRTLVDAVDAVDAVDSRTVPDEARRAPGAAESRGH